MSLTLLYIVSRSKEKSTILRKTKRLTQALVLPRNDSSLSEKQFGPWGAGRRRDAHSRWEGRRTDGTGSHQTGHTGELAGRASESSTMRPVWGWRHRLCGNRSGRVALSGHVSRTGALANEEGSIHTERPPHSLRDHFLCRDPSIAEGGSDK